MGLRPLVELAARAAAVVTEDMPVEPHLSWTATVSSALPPTAIMISCDTHCVRHTVHPCTIPPNHHDRAWCLILDRMCKWARCRENPDTVLSPPPPQPPPHTHGRPQNGIPIQVVPQRSPAASRSCSRAYSFRDATDPGRKSSLRNGSIAAQLTVIDASLTGPATASAAGAGAANGAAAQPPALELPFVDAEAWLVGLVPETAGLLAGSLRNVDPHPAPVGHINGGSGWGYRRWSAYKRSPSGLAAYGAKRNDFLSPNAVSRLSAHHHFGMVSPFTVACEAAGVGATKFVDEFLVWRELSYAFCAKQMVPHSQALELLPKWAAKTLAEHANNPRPRALTRQQLEKAETGDVFWDSMQRCLVGCAGRRCMRCMPTALVPPHPTLQGGEIIMGRPLGRSLADGLWQTVFGRQAPSCP